MIAYYFPPCGGVASVRSREFAKRLSDFNWSPCVLCASENAYDGFPIDVNTLNDIRSHMFIYRFPAKSPSSRFKFFYKLRMHCLIPHLCCPDAEVFNMISAFRSSVKIINKERVQAIYTTSGPRSAHIIGLFLSILYRIPWIADFRDPWIRHNDAHLKYPSVLYKMINEFLEWLVIKHATALIANTPGLSKMWITRYGDLVAKKTVVIPNGYSNDEFDKLSKQNGDYVNNDVISITVVGTVYGTYGKKQLNNEEPEFPESYFKTISMLKNRIPDLWNKLRFIFVGEFPEHNKQVIADFNIGDAVQVIGRVPRKEALEYMTSASINVLLAPANYPPYVVVARTYEVLRAGRPILAIASEGDITSLMREAGIYSIADPYDSDDQCNQMIDVLSNVLNRTEKLPNNEYISRFERQKLTERLVKVLDNVVN